MAKIGVLFSGCGVHDGSEIYEGTLTLYFLSKAGAQVQCFAPNMTQKHVINHLTGEETGEQRNVLQESARLARGVIEDIEDIEIKDLDALVLPGGFGAAKNLSTFAFDGVDCQVHPDVERLVRGMHEAGKPITALCIAPAVVGKILAGKGVKLTLGMDADMQAALEKMGHKAVECDVDEVCVDGDHKIVSTPAYMLAGTIAEAGGGIEQAIREMLRML